MIIYRGLRVLFAQTGFTNSNIFWLFHIYYRKYRSFSNHIPALGKCSKGFDSHNHNGASAQFRKVYLHASLTFPRFVLCILFFLFFMFQNVLRKKMIRGDDLALHFLGPS
jgi:hypothetical protein